LTLRSGLRATLDQSALGYKTVGELHAQLDTHETQLTNLETNNPTVVAVTATSDGLTTGLIPATATYVTLTCTNAAHIATLPAAAIGKTITLYLGGATASNIRTAASSNIKINNADADGGAADTALPAETLVTFTKVATDEWLTSAVDGLGASVTLLTS